MALVLQCSALRFTSVGGLPDEAMSLTDEQRRRIEDNRARARCRLRERRLTPSSQGAATSGGDANAAPAGGSREERQGSGGAAAGGTGAGSLADARDRGAHKELIPKEKREREAGPSVHTATAAVAAAAAAADAPETKPSAANRSTRSGGGGRARESRRAGGGGSAGRFDSSNGRSDSASVSGGGAGPAAGAALPCEGCGTAEEDARVDKELLEGFGVTVCRTCKLSRGEFQCVTKKEAKETYLLPEGTIAVLQFIERDNPHHSSWTKMKLYLRREVEAYSHKRWGGEDGLNAEKERRDVLKYDRSLARTKGVFKRRRSEAEDGGFAGGFL